MASGSRTKKSNKRLSPTTKRSRTRSVLLPRKDGTSITVVLSSEPKEAARQVLRFLHEHYGSMWMRETAKALKRLTMVYDVSSDSFVPIPFPNQPSSTRDMDGTPIGFLVTRYLQMNGFATRGG